MGSQLILMSNLDPGLHLPRLTGQPVGRFPSEEWEAVLTLPPWQAWRGPTLGTAGSLLAPDPAGGEEELARQGQENPELSREVETLQ